MPTTPITKSIPFTCDGVNYVKMIDKKSLGFGGPYIMLNNDFIYSLDSNKLSILDCNKCKIINSHEIGDKKVCYIDGYAGLKNSNFWLFYSTYLPNANYPNYELLSSIDSTGKAIHTFDFESDFSYAMNIKLSPTSDNGCIMSFVNYDKLYIYNFDENGKIVWKKILPCDYNTLYGISTKVSKVIELKSKELLYCIIIQGSTSDGSPQFTTKITKMNKSGDLIWLKLLSMDFTNRDPIKNIIEKSENSYIIHSRKNFINIDSTGTIVSQLESADYIYSKLLINRDGDIITGYNIQNNGGDIGLSKINEDGKIEWTKTYGGTGNESIDDIFELNSGGYYIIGSTTNLTGRWVKVLMTTIQYPFDKYYEYQKESISSYYFIKTDNKGNISN